MPCRTLRSPRPSLLRFAGRVAAVGLVGLLLRGGPLAARLRLAALLLAGGVGTLGLGRPLALRRALGLAALRALGRLRVLRGAFGFRRGGLLRPRLLRRRRALLRRR